jgi:uroporphyrinogen decarboxylase
MSSQEQRDQERIDRMGSRERVLKSLNHKEPDRCPTYTWMNVHTLRKLGEYLGVRGEPVSAGADGMREAVEAALGIDRWRRVRLPVAKAEMWDERMRRLIPDEYFKMENVSINSVGEVVKEHPDMTYFDDVLWYPLQEIQDPDEVDDYPFQMPDHIHLDKPTVDLVQELKKEDAVVVGEVQQPFKTACRLRGTENGMCDLILNPQITERIYDRLYAFNTAYCVSLAQAQADVVQIVGDIAMQDRLMMSPKIWRHFDKPRLAHLIAEVKRANPNTFVYMHTDGKVTDIIPDLVDVGLDILNPIQPECQDPIEVKKRWGDRLVLHGAVSNQRSIPLGTPQDVKNEVKHLLEHCGKDGGFVIGPANVLLPEYPTENIVAMYRAVSEYYA